MSKIRISGDMHKASVVAKGFIAEVDLNGALIETTGQPKPYTFEQLLNMEVVIELAKEIRRNAGIEDQHEIR